MAKKITAKQVICEGLLKGRKVDKILEQVAKKIPDSKADESHVRYYVNVLYKSGEMDDALKAKYTKGRGRPSTKEAKPKPTKAKKVTKADSMPKKVKKVKAKEAPAKKAKKVKKSSKKSSSKKA